MRGTASITTLLRSTRPSSTLPIRNVNIRYATTSMRMPAMSPTMTEGGIASWKLKEGDSFTAGDVLLEVETDKATIDVESQEDGIIGKIIVEAGSSKIPVGQVIAILAEEGDDLSSIKVPDDLSPPNHEGSSSSASGSSDTPKEEPKIEEKKVETKEEKPKRQEQESSSSSSSSSTNQKHEHKEIKHSKPLLPSVSRLLQESNLTSEQISKLKGSGRHGMLTKGDVLVALGKIKTAFGSAEKLNLDVMGPSGKRASENKATQPTDGAAPAKKETPLDGPALRRLILAGLSKATEPSKPIIQHTQTSLPLSSDAEFDSILSPYSSLLSAPKPRVDIPSQAELKDIESTGSAVAPKKDEWAGLF
ncbi:uncharacterized protein IL334_005554 [Kwoniella shivajii]|uniref:Pyruvate dehydrogenase X component n=1 Tax=Kwoniella shivajii TaxID=564305 RepID=A0ABZ1D3G4_9TREE|nr:hypothetical protein IL334_005554 [Kwoniella shivajii]